MLPAPGAPREALLPPARPRGLLRGVPARAGPEQGVLRGAPLPRGRGALLLSFPDASFSGLLTFHVTLLDDSNEVGAARTDRVGNGLPARRGRCPRRGGSWPPAAASPETKELAACLSPQWSLTKPGAGPRGQSASPPVSTCRISPSPPSSPTAWCSEWPPGS